MRSLLVALAIPLLATAAAADAPPPPPPPPPKAAPAPPPQAPPTRYPAPPTYTTPVTPTGELVGRGRFARKSNNALAFDLAVGITDRVELRVQSLVILLGDLQLRVSVLPQESRFRLVVGASAIGTFLDGGDTWLGGTVTAAYRGDRWSAHATARMSHHTNHPGDDIGLATAGVTFAVGKRATLFVDVVDAAWRHPRDCTGAGAGVAARASAPTPVPDPCSVVQGGPGVGFGLWWGDGDDALGLTALIVSLEDQVVPFAPLLTYSWID